MLRIRALAPLAVLVSVSLLAQQRASPQELKEAAIKVPQLLEVLNIKPGMTVADVGTGFGAMAMELSKWAGLVYATDITPDALTVLRAEVKERKLSNVTVLEGGASSTNLPTTCCDAILMRNVYHHIGSVDAFNRSLMSSLKPGGRLAIIDFAPEAGSKLPAGVPANRGGHGIPTEVVIDEFSAVGFKHLQTFPAWPPANIKGSTFLVLFRKE